MFYKAKWYLAKIIFIPSIIMKLYFPSSIWYKNQVFNFRGVSNLDYK